MVNFKRKTITINGNSYIAESIIGQGTYGIIYLGQSKGKLKDGTRIPKKIAIKEYIYARFNDSETGNNTCEEYWKKEVEYTRIQGQYPAAQMKLIDAGKINNHYYIVITYIKGITLKEWYSKTYGSKKYLNETEIVHISSQIIIPIALHLDFCHKKGLLHRDISIDNILIMEPKRNHVIPILIDWGAGKLRNPKDITPAPKNYVRSFNFLATAFMNKGTPPEIISGHDPLVASDIYMLGHLMYFLYGTGKVCRTPAIHEDYILHPKKENISLKPEYDNLVQKCTQYEPSDRFQDMTHVIHAIQKIEKNFKPEEITHFDKPRTIKSGFATKSPAIPNSSGSIKNNPIKRPIGTGTGIGNGTPSSINPINTPSPKINPIISGNKSPYGHFNSQSNSGGAVAVSVGNMPNHNPNLSTNHKIHFRPDPIAIQYANAFITYFENPRWVYLRQDIVQNYYYFFESIRTKLQSKTSFIQTDMSNSENFYYVGQTIGSLDEVRIILNYFKKVFKKAPQTKVIFLGNYFNLNKNDIETFTYILSYLCLYPNNIILLRGKLEEKTAMETQGLKAHLQLKFGNYAQYIQGQLLDIVSHFDLMHIAEISTNIKTVGSCGGIPFDPSNPNQPISLNLLNSQIQSCSSEKNQLNSLVQTILWGKPNEIADTHGMDSQGNFLFSWSQLKNFFMENSVQYLVGSNNHPSGHQTLWNMISNVNSSSFEKNQKKAKAKILRINRGGIADLDIKDLKFYFDRDYANLN